LSLFAVLIGADVGGTRRAHVPHRLSQIPA
jgi:hypothetical protein